MMFHRLSGLVKAKELRHVLDGDLPEAWEASLQRFLEAALANGKREEIYAAFEREHQNRPTAEVARRAIRTVRGVLATLERTEAEASD